MYEDEKDTKRKAKQLKKKGAKRLGGRLLKMNQLHGGPEVVKPKIDYKMKDSDGNPYIMKNLQGDKVKGEEGEEN